MTIETTAAAIAMSTEILEKIAVPTAMPATAITEITIEVENKDELKKVMNSLQRVDNVYEVKRRK